MRIVGNQQLSVGEKTTGYQFHIDLCSFDDADDGNTNDTENNNYTIAYGAARHNPGQHVNVVQGSPHLGLGGINSRST